MKTLILNLIYFLLSELGVFLSDIIEHNPDGNVERIVEIGVSENPISFKLYQDVYHQITGKTEQITKKYSQNLLVEFADIEQLHMKIMQLREVHNIIACNELITIFHDGERKEEFTSFEKFRTYNSSSVSPTTTLAFRYNFSIVPSGLNKAREYVIKIRVVSRVALAEQMEGEVPPFMRGRVLGMITANTAEIKIEYSDYVVARGFLESFDEWVKGCKRTEVPAFVSIMQKRSHLLKTLIPIFLVALLIYFALASISTFFGKDSTPETHAKFIVMYSGFAYFVIVLGGVFGRFMENAIDSYPILSYVKINKGDEALIERFSNSGKIIVFKFIFGVLLTVALGVVSCKLDRLV